MNQFANSCFFALLLPEQFSLYERRISNARMKKGQINRKNKELPQYRWELRLVENFNFAAAESFE